MAAPPDSLARRKKASSLGLQAENRAPLSLLVSDQLRKAIMSGRVSVGTELPSEKDLTEELGVGRSTIREALRILQAQGLVSGGDTVSTRRPRVSTEQALSSAAALAMENAVRLTGIPLRDLVEVRVVIEGAAVEAAARAEADALDDARGALAAMKTPGIDVESFRAADLLFHRSLASASGNAAFPLVMGVLRTAIASHLGEALHRERNVAATMRALTREHEAIFAAVSRGHGTRARKLLAKHIRSFYEKRDGESARTAPRSKGGGS